MEAVSLACQLFGALVLAVYAAPYFRWGDTRQNVEVRSNSWADASCYETACLIQSSVNELAMCGTGPDRTAILGHGETITPSTLGLLPGISVYTGTKCRAKLRYYNLVRSILVLQFEVDQALHLARANLAPHFT